MRLRYSKAINRLRHCVSDTVSQQINQSLLLLRSLSHKEIRAGIAAYTGKPVDDEEVTKLINHVSETWRLFLFPNAGLLSAMHMETYGMFFYFITWYGQLFLIPYDLSLFPQLDIDGDGEISYEEFSNNVLTKIAVAIKNDI